MKEVYNIFIQFHSRKIGINEFKEKLRNISNNINCKINYNNDFSIYDDLYNLNDDDEKKAKEINLCFYKSTMHI